MRAGIDTYYASEVRGVTYDVRKALEDLVEFLDDEECSLFVDGVGVLLDRIEWRVGRAAIDS